MLSQNVSLVPYILPKLRFWEHFILQSCLVDCYNLVCPYFYRKLAKSNQRRRLLSNTMDQSFSLLQVPVLVDKKTRLAKALSNLWQTCTCHLMAQTLGYGIAHWSTGEQTKWHDPLQDIQTTWGGWLLLISISTRLLDGSRPLESSLAYIGECQHPALKGMTSSGRLHYEHLMAF